MVPYENKHERMMALKQLLIAHPEGLRRAEMAKKLNVNPSTITRYITELGHDIPIQEQKNGKLFIDPDYQFEKIYFTLHEKMALYLASSLLVTAIDRSNLHIAAALRKLGNSLHKTAPLLGAHILTDAETFDNEKLVKDPQYLSNLEKVTEALSKAVKLRVSYQKEHCSTVTVYTFSPYAVIPYTAGNTLYTVGWCDERNEIRVFRLDRIKIAEVLKESYEIPCDFSVYDYFKDAWGIWRNKKGTSTVILQFSRKVSQRVQETQWHYNQSITINADGTVNWQAEIEEPREMLPWIRGWGADVEVLAPASLRQLLIDEVGRMYEKYF